MAISMTVVPPAGSGESSTVTISGGTANVSLPIAIQRETGSWMLFPLLFDGTGAGSFTYRKEASGPTVVFGGAVSAAEVDFQNAFPKKLIASLFQNLGSF